MNMKLASYYYRNQPSCGVVTEQGIMDIPSHPDNTHKWTFALQILQQGPQAMAQLKMFDPRKGTILDPDTVVLTSPITQPGKLLALACNYPQHLAEYAKPADITDTPRHTTTPWPFLMPGSALLAPNATIPWPSYSSQLDYEVELAVVIGKPCKDISAQQAADFIFGYTIANDISARSVTYKAGRANRPRDEFYDWLAGKWADGFLPLGPWVVSADEIGDPRNLGIELKVNGQLRQQSNTGRMTYNVYEIVAFLSHIMTLAPGDIICTGTPHGVGHATGNYLQAGDTIECAIEKIGTLTNTLGPKPQAFYEPLNAGAF
jgi:2-keto-4-pentenoate hydratase/2-oxohepta-3-ene-1,7-dioic acid hydratase in catechol pathway